ncbi:MAG: Arc family DNA-binding protein [Comamonadaceae bacterium]|nr:MAG: Arc family DNA-binding protein [Comamonadaceae bacterium]
MPNLWIKDVPEGVVEALRQRAARNHRSLHGELMAIISAAAEPPRVAASPVASPLLQGWRRGTRTIEDFIEDRRQRYPEPVRGGPLGVDIIREDRDSR